MAKQTSKPTAAEISARMGGTPAAQQAVPARLGIECPNATPMIEELGDGNIRLIFRLDQPWIKIIIPMTAEHAEALGKALSAPKVIQATPSDIRSVK
jgi:hypothetical protein